MNLSKTILEDMEETISDDNIPWIDLKSSSVLVTGATGMIGSAIVRTLFAANKRFCLNIKIIACARNEEKAKTLIENYNVVFIKNDIREPLVFDEKIDYIFHCAAVVKSTDMVSKPVDVADISLTGTKNILEFAKIKQVKSMVYISSMEVYGITNPMLDYIKEDDLGYIDIKMVRSSYPESKRMCECLCNCWFSQFGIPVKIARLSQIFGAGSSKEDTRVFAQFARSVIKGNDIILHTEGKSYGNYCYISDAIRGVILLLLNGKNGEAYNIVNPESSVTIKEMAELVANNMNDNKINVKIELPQQPEKMGYAPDVTMRLSSKKIETIGWKSKYNLIDMYNRMISDWQGN